eukprot:UC4_evm5s302
MAAATSTALVFVPLLVVSVNDPIDMGPTYGKDYVGGQSRSIVSIIIILQDLIMCSSSACHIPSCNTRVLYSLNRITSLPLTMFFCLTFCHLVFYANIFSNISLVCSFSRRDCPPNSGTDNVGVNVKNTQSERCCLKSAVPVERSNVKHWTGVAPRAVQNGAITPSCKVTPPPPPGSPIPYPGPNFTHPRIHQSPDCLHRGGWHDMAGALTFEGIHHAFQGCPGSGGCDLVHWEDLGRGVHALQETYEGMESDITPCSGFVTVDDNNVPCAGFRQCGSKKGTTGLNPAAQSWDVPMEIRCAENANLTQWSDPIWIYPVYYYRALPYDPVRPWKDFDGKWYSSWSTDGCNFTTKKLPCGAGGQLELLVSDALHGPKANWQQLEPMFTTNITKSGAAVHEGAITREFVTSGYFGGVPGDPDGGLTRVVTQNNAGPTYWVGKQANGSKFVPYWDKIGAVGHYDYGSLTMARTLGSDPNQVARNGRRVLIGWIGGGSPASQSLARDLSLSDDYELLQAFVPELQVLRIFGSKKQTKTSEGSGAFVGATVRHSGGSLRLEILATFTWTGAHPT